MGPSPSRSPGRNELREEGVARCCSPPSIEGAPHKDEPPDGADHSWLPPPPPPPPQVSPPPALADCPPLPPDPLELELGPEPGRMLAQPPPEFCACELCSCAIRLCTSLSAGDSAKMVVLPSTQLFSAP